MKPLFDVQKIKQDLETTDTLLDHIVRYIIPTVIIFIVLQLITMSILDRSLKRDVKIIKNKVECLELIRNSSVTYNELPSEYLGYATLSYYTPTELGAKSASQLRTKSGTIPKQGRTIAVDPKFIPLGSIVYIEHEGYFVAEDTGSAIKGMKVDIFLNNYNEAIEKGNKKQARVYILQ